MSDEVVCATNEKADKINSCGWCTDVGWVMNLKAIAVVAAPDS